jgi:hypothetical protein
LLEFLGAGPMQDRTDDTVFTGPGRAKNERRRTTGNSGPPPGPRPRLRRLFRAS